MGGKPFLIESVSLMMAHLQEKAMSKCQALQEVPRRLTAALEVGRRPIGPTSSAAVPLLSFAFD